jgi:hypothetical protein
VFLFCHPSAGVSYHNGFLLLFKGLLPGLQFFFGQDVGCPFDPLKLLRADDQGFSRGVLFWNTDTGMNKVREKRERKPWSPCSRLLCPLPLPTP